MERSAKKNRHPLAETVRGEGQPSFTSRLVGVEEPELQAFAGRGQAAQAAVNEQLRLCTCGDSLAAHDQGGHGNAVHRWCRRPGCPCISFTPTPEAA